MRRAWKLIDGPWFDSKGRYYLPPSHPLGGSYYLFMDDELQLDTVNEELNVGWFTVVTGIAVMGIEIPMERVVEYEENRKLIIR